MRLVMIGTGPFGVPTFRSLYDTYHTIVALVTSPIVPDRKGRKIPPSKLREIALEHQTPIYEPADINSPESQALLRSFEADLLVVCDYGQILSGMTLATARLGGINLHASLLPKYRGAAPINWAIYHGETETGVSVIHMTPKVDAGPIIAQGRVSIDPDETAEELERRLAEIGAWFVRRSIDSLEAGLLEALPQDPALASKAPRLKKSDGLIRWERPAEAIRNHIRAMVPWPRTYTYWYQPKRPPVRLIIGKSVVDSLRDDETPVSPGTVLSAGKEGVRVMTGEGVLRILELQPAGRRMMRAEEFVRGYRIEAGHRLGPEAEVSAAT
ncbi:MAG: methionyl-tRNA formyltransferase [Planctomycetota bacterium]|nr:MAG: methionyl-tRNA formyltransferase [Planctomycetota bacterium]